MPTYEFRCPEGHEFERFYKTMSTAPSEVKCPVCGALAERQLSGGGGLVFKGSGFYLTDYGKNAHRGTAPDAKGESTKSDGAKSEGGKSEGAKTDGAKSEGSKAESSASKSESKADAPKPKAESQERSDSSKSSKPKPKSE